MLRGRRMATSDELAAAVEGHTIAGEFAKTAARRADLTALRWRTPDGGGGELMWRGQTPPPPPLGAGPFRRVRPTGRPGRALLSQPAPIHRSRLGGLPVLRHPD